MKGALVTGFLFATLCSAVADERDFYAGKQMQFIIRSAAGSGYDQYARLLGKYMTRHIPGAPVIAPVNMPGGGGLQAANYVAVKAPRDGTVLTMVGQGLPVDQALGLAGSLQADMKTFNWVGNVSSSNQTLIAWHTAPVRTLRDAIERESIFGAAGAGSISTQLPAAFNSLIGTKFRILIGYPGTGDLALAMERGEIHGSDFTLATIKAVRPDFLSKGLINVLAQIGLEKESDLADVPLMRDLARRPEDQATIDYISRATAVGRPVATTPGVPPERVAMLRAAFDATLADPDFIREAARQNLEIKPMNGAQLQDIVRSLIDAPPDLLERVRAAIQPKTLESR